MSSAPWQGFVLGCPDPADAFYHTPSPNAALCFGVNPILMRPPPPTIMQILWVDLKGWWTGADLGSQQMAVCQPPGLMGSALWGQQQSPSFPRLGFQGFWPAGLGRISISWLHNGEALFSKQTHLKIDSYIQITVSRCLALISVDKNSQTRPRKTQLERPRERMDPSWNLGPLPFTE